MKTTSLREQLHRQIDLLPDELVTQIADFALFLASRREAVSTYAEWTEEKWQEFVLGQFFREDDEVSYSIADAKEVYRP